MSGYKVTIVAFFYLTYAKIWRFLDLKFGYFQKSKSGHSESLYKMADLLHKMTDLLR